MALNWWRRLTRLGSRPSRGPRPRPSRGPRPRQPRALVLERLETRLAPVIGANAFAPAVPRGGDFDGVVQLTNTAGNVSGSGVLLSTGRHVLTAAHVVDADGNHVVDGDVTVRFDLVRGGANINIPIAVPANRVTLNPGWDPRTVANDLAVLTLTDAATGGQ